MRINKCVNSCTISTIWLVQFVEPKLCVRVCACVWLMLIMTEIMVIMTMMIIIYWFPSKGRVPNQNVDSEGTECWFWRHRMLFLKAYPLCMFIKCTNKMGRLRRMLILKTSPHQQMVSLRWTEATNCTVTEHHPHQQMCWSTKWVGHPDCSFWHPFTFLVTPTSTKWATGPIWVWGSGTSEWCCQEVGLPEPWEPWPRTWAPVLLWSQDKTLQEFQGRFEPLDQMSVLFNRT